MNSTTRTKSTPLRAACYDGHVEIVEYLVNNGADVEIANRHGHTCLMIACYKGHFRIAKFLIETCKADVNRKSVKGNTALHDCAESGSIQIMELLLSKDAKMTSDSYGVTPLIAAALTGHSQIVELIISNPPLTGYSTGRSSPGSSSSGHSSRSLRGRSQGSGRRGDGEEFIQTDEEQVSSSEEEEEEEESCEATGTGTGTGSPGVGKVGQLVGQVVQKVAGHNEACYTGHCNGEHSLGSQVISTTSRRRKVSRKQVRLTQVVSKQEKIDALQLLGATFVDKKRDMMAALEYWRRAIRERNSGSGSSELLMKAPTSFNGRSPNEAYNNMTECMTETQLEQLFSDPDDMRMQSLLLRERILGPSHPDTSYYIRYRGAVYADTGNFDRCIKLWMYALDMQTNVLDPLNPMIQSSLLSFAELFSFMMSKGVTTVKFDDLFEVLKRSLGQLMASSTMKGKLGSESEPSNYQRTSKSVSESEASNYQRTSKPVSESESSNYHRTLVIILHFIGLICRVKGQMKCEEEMVFKKVLYAFVQCDPRGKKMKTPLHLACGRDSSYQSLRFPLCDFPMPEMVKVLIEVGSDVNQVDDENNTPLHDSSNYKPFKKPIFKLLLENGAHLDVKNDKGETPFTLYRMNAPIPVVDASLLEAVRASGGLHPDPMGGLVSPSSVSSQLSSASSLHQHAPSSSNASQVVSPTHSLPGAPSMMINVTSNVSSSPNAPASGAPSPREILREKLQSLYPLKYISLQCLAAQTIVKSTIHYKGLLPEHLESFVNSH